MKRRHIIATGAIAAASTAALGACAQQNTGPAVQTDLPQVRWKMAASWPKSLETIFGGAQTVCQRVADMTDGKFTITPYAAGEIVGGLEVMDAVQAGSVQCGHTASYYYIGKNPVLGFATAVPFGLNAQQQNAWLYHGGGLEAIHKVYADFGIINFPAGNTGTQMGGWFKREIKSLADLKGLKMRIPGLGGEVMTKLGVNVQAIPGGEVYLALERGAIDAAEWVGPYDDEKLGLNKAAPFYYYPGWWEPGATLDILVNLAAWNKLPKMYQEIFKSAAFEANANMLAQYDSLNQKALAKLIAGGTKLRPYSQDIMEQAQKVAFEMYEENASKSPDFKAIYEPWKAFRNEINQWHQVNELSFANFSFAAASPRS
ncbi:TRAP transporter substrate-binding protein [[Phormidium] sp. ETS-05]|uniref:TRAP transporter substrate-binding protein n=1 Tax=[Phormidium] sp. ETS-05 TaxID=222819 RepID=UPI0018EF2210|nr:TRAP transporter substrate-binding protein [[Phormidium] sp. ETS-05]